MKKIFFFYAAGKDDTEELVKKKKKKREKCLEKTETFFVCLLAEKVLKKRFFCLIWE